ncbi:hypothetical protein IU487_35545 [Nocardia puris]|uniref:hypothetical protein n=1 Tax=Nocardia puris TaxID=208602 RepID=UPI001893C179|nr:hypothetical protein [Nocardia puris]MBF6216307.1 hypothetical protein [Nocardia puris]
MRIPTSWPRPRTLAAAGAITAVAVLAALLLTGTRDRAPDPGTVPPGTGTGPPTSPAPRPPSSDLFGHRLDTAGGESGSTLPQDPATRPDPSRPDYLAAPPAGLVWQRLWVGAAAPVSASDGPAAITDGIATGFAPTPQGAALAAADALARALAAPDPIWRDVLADRFYTETPRHHHELADRFARARAATGPVAAMYVVVPSGVRVTAYRPGESAQVHLAFRARVGWTYATWPMAWVQGDWRVRVPVDVERLWAAATPVTDLSAFGDWTTP